MKSPVLTQVICYDSDLLILFKVITHFWNDISKDARDRGFYVFVFQLCFGSFHLLFGLLCFSV